MAIYREIQMTATQEIKSQLARLLATEDLVVEHRQVQTASFNVGTRVLTLPLWEKASNAVYDMLVGHEVSHALFTPDIEWWIDNPVPHGVVNVVEDMFFRRCSLCRGLSKVSFSIDFDKICRIVTNK